MPTCARSLTRSFEVTSRAEPIKSTLLSTDVSARFCQLIDGMAAGRNRRDTIMKLIALIVLCVAAVLGVGYVKYPDEFEQTSSVVIAAQDGCGRTSARIRCRSRVALGTFLLTVAYHKAKGKSLRESVEVAATRVAVIPVAVADSQDEHPVVRRARARATRVQLLADQIGLQNRRTQASGGSSKGGKGRVLHGAGRRRRGTELAEKQKHHDEAVARLERLPQGEGPE